MQFGGDSGRVAALGWSWTGIIKEDQRCPRTKTVNKRLFSRIGFVYLSSQMRPPLVLSTPAPEVTTPLLFRRR